MLEEFPTARTFPQIIFNGVKIGGFDALETIVKHQDSQGD